MNQQYENATKSGIEPETFPLLEGHCTTWAVSEQQPNGHILALDALAYYTILQERDLKDEKEIFKL